MIRPLLAAIVLAPTAWLAAQGQPQVFRGGTDVVAVDVTVQDGKRPIAGLTAADFDVRDNGVRQVVTQVTYARVPIDVRLVFDTSGSISDAQLKGYLKTMVDVTAALQPDDRCDIVSFAARIVDAAPLQSPPIKIDLQRAEPNATSFFDAVSVSLITAPVAGRRQLTIVLSDADDNSSFFDQTTLIDTGRRTDAVVYAVLPDTTGIRHSPARDKMLKDRLSALTTLTGGRVMPADKDLTTAFLNALEDFRKSYVVVYTATGVAHGGWHELKITVPKSPQYTVRSKQGYMG
jgi:VWFA-related protein